MHHYGLHSAKYGFIFLATAQAPHRRFFFLPKIQLVSHLSANNLTIARLPGTWSPHKHAVVLYLVQSKYLVPIAAHKPIAPAQW